MNKKILAFVLTLLFLSSCSLFQKNNTEQTSTLPDTPEQQEVITQSEKDSETSLEWQSEEKLNQLVADYENLSEKEKVKIDEEIADWGYCIFGLYLNCVREYYKRELGMESVIKGYEINTEWQGEESTQTWTMEKSQEKSKITEEQKEENLSVKEQILEEQKNTQKIIEAQSQQEEIIVSNPFPTDYTKF